MAQYDLYLILKNNKNRWLTSTNIANYLNRKRNSITPSLKRLAKSGNIKRRNKNNLEYEYKYIN